jgi:macrolide transport system ATP-binding/permease protein
MIQTLLGLAVGIPVALLSARFVQSQLYEIASVHLLVLTGAVLTLAVAACIAGLIPAHRAASIDPQAFLRIDRIRTTTRKAGFSIIPGLFFWG